MTGSESGSATPVGADATTLGRAERSLRRPGRGTPQRSAWIGLALCLGVVLGWLTEQLLPVGRDDAPPSAPGWLPLIAAALVAAAFVPWVRSSRTHRAGYAIGWAGLFLMVWAANGLPFDLLTMAGLMGHRTATGAIVMSTVYLPGLVTRTFALAAAILLARFLLAQPPASASARTATWYAYAAFLLALPYPLLRVHWALGGSLGLAAPGAAGEGWEPLLIAIPWVLAAGLSLLLVSPPHWMPRGLLLAAGWSATAIVAMIGPAALWSFLTAVAGGGDTGSGGIELWVFGLFYGSWFLWAIAAAAATRLYQLRSAPIETSGAM